MNWTVWFELKSWKKKKDCITLEADVNYLLLVFAVWVTYNIWIELNNKLLNKIKSVETIITLKYTKIL